jgi:hypothetical protein
LFTNLGYSMYTFESKLGPPLVVTRKDLSAAFASRFQISRRGGRSLYSEMKLSSCVGVAVLIFQANDAACLAVALVALPAARR